jgi:hypothetical protein
MNACVNFDADISASSLNVWGNLASRSKRDNGTDQPTDS